MTRAGFFLLTLTAALAACTAPAPKHEAGPTVAPSAGRLLLPPKPRRNDTLRVLLSHDMEGLSGQDDWRTFAARFPEQFKQGQRLLAGDVNAVVDGLFAGGATVVDVFDQHGSGQPDSIPDLPRELLDPRARHVFMSEAISAEIAAKGDYDALATVGEHSKTGSGGFAAHTVTLGIEVLLNDMAITEVELKAYQWGQFGVPLIFSAGDDKLQEDLKTAPWIEYVVVKRATSASSAELIPVEQVHAEMREKAKRAVQNLARAKVMQVTTPVRITVRAVPPATLEDLTGFPGVHYAEQAVTFTAPALSPEGFNQLVVVVSAASSAGENRLLRETLATTPPGRELVRSAQEKYWTRWLDYESGRWRPAAETRH